jgi:hypothetical protein
MNEQEQKVLDEFRKLNPEIKAIAQSNISMALAVQENTIKSIMDAAKGATQKPEKRKPA